MYLEEMELVTDTNYKVYTPVKVAREMTASIFVEYFRGGNKKKKLDELRAADISCGTGNLLIILLESLIRISKIYYGEYRYNENWIKGYDIDKDALEVFKQRFNKLLAKYSLEGELKVYHSNSLLEDIEGNFNIIIGNPPYLGEKNNKEIFENIKETEFGQKYYEGKMDYLYFFIEKGIDALCKGGILSYITTNYWLRADFAVKLREKIKEETSFTYINNYNKSVFKNANGQHNIVFTMAKTQKNIFKVVEESRKYETDNRLMYDRDNKVILAPKEKLLYFEKILNKKNYYLKDILNINQGIVSGLDKAFVMKDYREKFKERLKPFYKNSDVNRYEYKKENSYWILYLNKENEPSKEIVDYLRPHRERLERRREVKKGTKEWWELQWGRKEEIFRKDKIVAKQRSLRNDFALVEGEFYASADVYYLTPKEDINLYYILAYLNSKVFYNWFKYNGKNKGVYLELYATPLKNTPIYYPEDSEEIERIADYAKILSNGIDEEIEEKVEEYFYNLYK